MADLLVARMTFPDLEHGAELVENGRLDAWTFSQRPMIVLVGGADLQTGATVAAILAEDDRPNALIHDCDQQDFAVRTDIGATPASDAKPPVDNTLRCPDFAQ